MMTNKRNHFSIVRLTTPSLGAAIDSADINVAFNALALFWDPEVVAQLRSVFADRPRKAKPEMQESWLGTISLLNQRSDAPSSRCTVDVVVALNLLSISFIKFERVAPLAVVDVTKFRARGTFDSSTLSVEGSLGNFRIQNPRRQSLPIGTYLQLWVPTRTIFVRVQKCWR